MDLVTGAGPRAGRRPGDSVAARLRAPSAGSGTATPTSYRGIRWPEQGGAPAEAGAPGVPTIDPCGRTPGVAVSPDRSSDRYEPSSALDRRPPHPGLARWERTREPARAESPRPESPRPESARARPAAPLVRRAVVGSFTVTAPRPRRRAASRRPHTHQAPRNTTPTNGTAANTDRDTEPRPPSWRTPPTASVLHAPYSDLATHGKGRRARRESLPGSRRTKDRLRVRRARARSRPAPRAPARHRRCAPRRRSRATMRRARYTAAGAPRAHCARRAERRRRW